MISPDVFKPTANYINEEIAENQSGGRFPQHMNRSDAVLAPVPVDPAFNKPMTMTERVTQQRIFAQYCRLGNISRLEFFAFGGTLLLTFLAFVFSGHIIKVLCYVMQDAGAIDNDVKIQVSFFGQTVNQYIAEADRNEGDFSDEFVFGLTCLYVSLTHQFISFTAIDLLNRLLKIQL